MPGGILDDIINGLFSRSGNAPGQGGILGDLISGRKSLMGYPNANAAAEAAARYYHPDSVAKNRETAGAVYGLPWLGYVALPPQYGNGNDAGQSMSVHAYPAASALYHTHGAQNYSLDGENFSPQDKTWAVRQDAPLFLSTSSRVIKRYDPATDSVTITSGN